MTNEIEVARQCIADLQRKLADAQVVIANLEDHRSRLTANVAYLEKSREELAPSDTEVNLPITHGGRTVQIDQDTMITAMIWLRETYPHELEQKLVELTLTMEEQERQAAAEAQYDDRSMMRRYG